MQTDAMRQPLETARHIFENEKNAEAANLFYQACCQGLGELLENFDDYIRTVDISSSQFYASFMQNIQEINSLASENRAQEKLQDLAFSLCEELAVFIRERHLRFLNSPTSSAAYAVMGFFENSGHWKMEDSTKISEYYYTILPSMVELKLTGR